VVAAAAQNTLARNTVASIANDAAGVCGWYALLLAAILVR
jgi:hypothetical protein